MQLLIGKHFPDLSTKLFLQIEHNVVSVGSTLRQFICVVSVRSQVEVPIFHVKPVSHVVQVVTTAVQSAQLAKRVMTLFRINV